jgi:hypothetical protein
MLNISKAKTAGFIYFPLSRFHLLLTETDEKVATNFEPTARLATFMPASPQNA